MTITGVLLAAGASLRMRTGNKLLLKYRNHTVIEEALARLANSNVDDIIIVTGFERARIERAVKNSLSERIRCIHNRDYRLGRAESIKCAIRHVSGRSDAALFMVADKPTISTSLINRAVERYLSDRPAILYVEHPGGRGHPIIFSKTIFDELLTLQGDLVGNELVAKYADSIVKLKDNTAQIDIDNERDYQILLQSDSGNVIT